VDVAVRAYWRGHLRSPWIFSTDADATLPRDYFATRAAPDSAALCFPFRHVGVSDATVTRATLAYEFELRYRVLGLWHAGCSYAFHTIGSCIAVHAESYAGVRGFPQRAAGEDFHLLQKLAKLGPIEIPETDPILLESRASDRVPFGTGPSVQRLLDGQPLLLDDPRCFDALRLELSALRERNRHPRELARALERCDALYCQQLVHRVRNQSFPRVEACVAVGRAPFLPVAVRSSTDLGPWVEALRQAEHGLPRQRGPTVGTPSV
jgi:hypothetical protein